MSAAYERGKMAAAKTQQEEKEDIERSSMLAAELCRLIIAHTDSLPADRASHVATQAALITMSEVLRSVLPAGVPAVVIARAMVGLPFQSVANAIVQLPPLLPRRYPA